MQCVHIAGTAGSHRNSGSPPVFLECAIVTAKFYVIHVVFHPLCRNTFYDIIIEGYCNSGFPKVTVHVHNNTIYCIMFYSLSVFWEGRRYFSFTWDASRRWSICSRARTTSFQEAVGLRSSQYWKVWVLYSSISPWATDDLILFSSQTGTLNITPNKNQLSTGFNSSSSCWIWGAGISTRDQQALH